MSRQFAAARVLLGVSLMLGWIGTAINLPPPGNPGSSGWLQERLADPATFLPVGSLVAALSVATAWMRRPILPIVGIFAIYSVYAFVEHNYDATAFTLTHGKYLPGNGALMLALGLWWGRDDPDGGWRRGVDYACGIVAALYVWAGMIKLMVGGLAWASQGNIGMLVLERSFIVSGALSHVRLGAASIPGFVNALGTLAVLIEVSGLTMLIPEWRLRFALTVTLMHLSIGMLLGYFFVEWCLFSIAMALMSREFYASPAFAPRRTSPVHPHRLVEPPTGATPTPS